MPRSSTSMLRERRWAIKASLREQPKESAPAMILRGGVAVGVLRSAIDDGYSCREGSERFAVEE